MRNAVIFPCFSFMRRSRLFLALFIDRMRVPSRLRSKLRTIINVTLPLTIMSFPEQPVPGHVNGVPQNTPYYNPHPSQPLRVPPYPPPANMYVPYTPCFIRSDLTISEME